MEQLIDTVRRYPCLWNTTAIEYRDQELKDAAWAEVLKETDLSSVKDVKQKWKKLRDSYRDALKRAGEGGGAGAGAGGGGKRACPWKYAARMHFLQPYMGGRRKAESPPAPAPAASSSGESEPEEPAARRRRAGAARDPLDSFFAGMCEATRRLPAHTQIAIKKSLFASVIAAEEALLAERRHAACGAPPPPWPRARPRRAPSSSGSDAPPS